MAIQTLASQTGAKPARIRRVQNVTLVLLFIAGIVNFLDRSSLSVAGEAIRGDLGLSATEFGVLLSAFSLSYGFAQLPSGMLLDRFGPRIVLGAGLIFWSLMQALTGMVNSFSHFILLRIGLGIGEAPFMPAGVKSINDWYVQKERGTAVGIFNSSTVLGQAIAPPALVLMQIAWGWRTMFVVIGLAGIVVGLCWYAWYRNRAQFDLQQDERLYLAASVQARPTLNFSEWLGLFKRRTTWGMILGFSGVNYTGWLYIAWLPGYLQAQQGLSLAKRGGWRPFLSWPLPLACGLMVLSSMPWRAGDMIWRRHAKPRLLLVCCFPRWARCWWCSPHRRLRPWLLSRWRCSAFILPEPRRGGWYRCWSVSRKLPRWRRFRISAVSFLPLLPRSLPVGSSTPPTHSILRWSLPPV